eukprot:CAMPEP_0170521362 /NCGR_PEP_ID=MMETSP0209-20121228/6694_1 /TAXON_ID=665100 ORGANISM="Litonotus pictus, Strain P1" /NCGR_SAMPLE_ID=MMETSP0209 /ASSEMBLY_ACC=CAM_ASM_000301 /LENGTH=201 /DNA_ID=CAMNT_0010808167 /DNA_START=114 /DNA_END=716 /DNA_ORIENTATION=-
MKVQSRNKGRSQEEDFNSLYLKDQPDLEFFRQRKYFQSKVQESKTKKPFIIEKEVNSLKNNSDHYLASHNNREIFLSIFANYTKNSYIEGSVDSRDLLEDYFRHRRRKGIVLFDVVEEESSEEDGNSSDTGSSKDTQWQFDYIKQEYKLPKDIQRYSDYYKWKMIMILLNSIEKLPIIDTGDIERNSASIIKHHKKKRLFF